MSFATIRQALAYAADHLGNQIFETNEYQERVRQALDATEKWHQRECPLKAPLVMCFLFMMLLHRSLSLADLVVKLLAQYRSEFPELSLQAVTIEAVCHARRRLGSDPLRTFFESQAAEVRPSTGLLGLRFWAMERMHFAPELCLVTYRSDSQGRIRKMSALDFLADLSVHVPDPGKHGVKYLGRCSNRSRGERRKRDALQAPAQAPPAVPPSRRTFRMAWAQLLKKVWRVDVTRCPGAEGPHASSRP